MENNASSSENVVTDLFDDYGDVQREILQIKLRKTKSVLITLAIILFIGDFLSLVLANAVSGINLLYALAYPVVFVGLAFLSLKEPLIAMIVAALLLVAIWGYLIYLNGIISLFTGWIVKAVIIYFFIAGFQHAIEANTIKKELKG